MSVHRLTPLPVAMNRGRLLVPDVVARQTQRALQRFRGADGRHEGLVYWLGRKNGDDTLVASAFVPPSDHGPQHVFIVERDVGPMSQIARNYGLAVVTQVHSHPGSDTRHSDGDDRLILMPFDGLFSLVVGNYGDGGLTAADGAGLHQYQNGRWVQIPQEAGALIVIPSLIWACDDGS